MTSEKAHLYFCFTLGTPTATSKVKAKVEGGSYTQRWSGLVSLLMPARARDRDRDMVFGGMLGGEGARIKRRTKKAETEKQEQEQEQE